MATASVPRLGTGDHASCIAPSPDAALQVRTRRYIAASVSPRLAAAAEGSSRTMLAVTISAPVGRCFQRSTLHLSACADCAVNAATSPSTTSGAGAPSPDALTAP